MRRDDIRPPFAHQRVERGDFRRLRLRLRVGVFLTELRVPRHRLHRTRTGHRLRLVGKLRREEHPSARPAAIGRLHVVHARGTAHDDGLRPRRGLGVVDARARHLPLVARAPAGSLADCLHPVQRPDLPVGLACRQHGVIRAVGLQDESAAEGELRQGAVIADDPHRRLEDVVAVREVDLIRLILPVLDHGAVRSARDERTVQRQVEPLVRRDVDRQLLRVRLRREPLAELEKDAILRCGRVTRHRLPVRGKFACPGRLRRPDPARPVDRLHLDDVGVPARDARFAENAPDGHTVGKGQMRHAQRKRSKDDCLVSHKLK